MRYLLFIIMMLFASCMHEDRNAQDRIDQLGHELRCPVCRGIPIADSPAEMAKQMMVQLREQVANGKNDDEILRYFEDRYGEWVLLRPKPQGMNIIVWVFPLLFFVGGALLIVKRKW